MSHETHDDPVYIVDGVVHYCVANMPGVVGLSSTIAPTNATLKYGLLIAEHGLEQACRASKAMSLGVNLHLGKYVYKNVAESLDIKYTPLESVLE